MRKTMRQLTAGIDSIAKPVKVDNNTIRYTDSKGNLRYRLHHTDVVIIHPVNGLMTFKEGELVNG